MRREKTKRNDKAETRENPLQRGRNKPGKRKRNVFYKQCWRQWGRYRRGSGKTVIVVNAVRRFGWWEVSWERKERVVW